MKTSIVQRVENWFLANCQQLSESYPVVHFRLMHATDKVRGKVVIEVDGGPAVVAITFWNKGDVTAVALETAHPGLPK